MRDALIDHEARLLELETQVRELSARSRAPAWATWVPTMTQGVALTITVQSARYSVYGKELIAQCRVSIGSAGTAGQAITFGGLPKARTNAYGTIDGICGTFHYYTGTQYFCGAQVSGGGFAAAGIAHAAGTFGVNPAVTAAAGHIAILFVAYEIA